MVEIFRDRELDELESKVLISNQTIANAAAQYRGAQAALRRARAGFFPTLGANLSVTHARSSSSSRGGTIATVPGSGASAGSVAPGQGSTTFYSLPLSLSWEADLWGRVRRLTESSEASAQASLADLESARLSAQSELAQTYFNLRSLDAQRALLEAATHDFESVLAVTKNRYAVGVASSSDVLQAESQLDSTRAQAIDLGVARAQLQHAIAVLIGEPAPTFSLAAAAPPGTVPEYPVLVPSEVLERRPDVAAAERRVAAANAQIGVAIAAFYPRLTLGASIGFSTSTIGDWFTSPSLFWSVGPGLAAILFDGGARGAQLDQARAAYDAEVATYRQTTLTAFQEVEDNLAALRILREEAEVQARAVSTARRAVEISRNQYRAGTAAYTDLLIAETSAVNIEVSAADTLGRRLVATVLLIKALGGGWQRGKDTPSGSSAKDQGATPHR